MRELMKNSFNLLSAMEYLHSEELGNLENELLKRFQNMENTSNNALSSLETGLEELNRRSTITSNTLESLS